LGLASSVAFILYSASHPYFTGGRPQNSSPCRYILQVDWLRPSHTSTTAIQNNIQHYPRYNTANLSRLAQTHAHTSRPVHYTQLVPESCTASGCPQVGKCHDLSTAHLVWGSTDERPQTVQIAVWQTGECNVAVVQFRHDETGEECR